MGGKCPYSWCLVGCCRQDLMDFFNCQIKATYKVTILVVICSGYLEKACVQQGVQICDDMNCYTAWN